MKLHSITYWNCDTEAASFCWLEELCYHAQRKLHMRKTQCSYKQNIPDYWVINQTSLCIINSYHLLKYLIFLKYKDNVIIFIIFISDWIRNTMLQVYWKSSLFLFPLFSLSRHWQLLITNLCVSCWCCVFLFLFCSVFWDGSVLVSHGSTSVDFFPQ